MHACTHAFTRMHAHTHMHIYINYIYPSLCGSRFSCSSFTHCIVLCARHVAGCVKWVRLQLYTLGSINCSTARVAFCWLTCFILVSGKSFSPTCIYRSPFPYKVEPNSFSIVLGLGSLLLHSSPFPHIYISSLWVRTSLITWCSLVFALVQLFIDLVFWYSCVSLSIRRRTPLHPAEYYLVTDFEPFVFVTG